MISYEKITGYNNKKEGVKCMICNHYYFKNKFNYQPYVCNDCHDFSMTIMNLSDFSILNTKGNDYRVYISNIDKKEAIIIFKKSNLVDKRSIINGISSKKISSKRISSKCYSCRCNQKKMHLVEHILETFILM